MQFGDAGGVAALADVHHFAHAQVQARLDQVDQRGLADAGGSGHDGDVVSAGAGAGLRGRFSLGAGEEERVSGLLVQLEHLSGSSFTAEVDLVDDDEDVEFGGLGGDQEAVEHAQVGVGIGDGKDDHDLVRVGQDHILEGMAAAGPDA